MSETLAALYKNYEAILAALGALVIALQVLIAAVLSAAKALKAAALMTQSKRDDEFFEALSFRLARWHDALDRAQRLIPRPRLGKEREPLAGSTIPPPRSQPPPSQAS